MVENHDHQPPNVDTRDSSHQEIGASMDMTNLMLSLLFGTCGMGFVMYGRKAGSFVPMSVGLLLMVCPYFITSALLMLVICGGLVAVPFVLREA